MCSSSTRSVSLSTTSLGLRPAIAPTVRRPPHHPFKRDGIYGGQHLVGVVVQRDDDRFPGRHRDR